jgi:hypothetical protein
MMSETEIERLTDLFNKNERLAELEKIVRNQTRLKDIQSKYVEGLEAALNDIADGNRDDCGDCKYNAEIARQALGEV